MTSSPFPSRLRAMPFTDSPMLEHINQPVMLLEDDIVRFEDAYGR